MLFYIGYFYRKFVTNAFEIVRPRWAAYRLHLAYVASKFWKSFPWRTFATFDEMTTTEAHYFIRPKTFDAICASPDYERPDVELTKQLISTQLKRGNTVLYMDIGANIGCYGIRLANAFRNTSGLSILAYEPYPESYELLQKNILVNKLSGQITAINLALGDVPGNAQLWVNEIDAGSNSLRPKSAAASDATAPVTVSRLDDDETAWAARREATVLFLKLDCEGTEIPVLQGGQRFLSHSAHGMLMVEDCVDRQVETFLAEHQWERLAKLTPYNSFWRKRSAS